MEFTDLGLVEPLLRAIRDERYVDPTPIQQQAIAPVLAGQDLLGCAQTGTGKTAAFALPILQRLMGQSKTTNRRAIRCLVMAPTRELAAQIAESFAAYGRYTGLRHTVIFGGVNQNPQCRALSAGVDILVATPGRLLDLLGQRKLSLGSVEVLVLDEADRMLDMGFLPDIRRVLAQVPPRRQTLLFSATVPTDIRKLASELLSNPVQVSVAPEAPAAETVAQSVYLVEKSHKQDLLQQLLRDRQVSRAIVFTRTKHGADRVAQKLGRAGIEAQAIHGNKSQNARVRAMEGFRSGRTRVLVASDIAARGIDVAEISHVFNFDMPNEAETYVHRIGRTGRAGATGMAISFCGSDERPYLRDIEKLTGQRLPVVKADGTLVAEPTEAQRDQRRSQQHQAQQRQHQQRIAPRDPSPGPAQDESTVSQGPTRRRRRRRGRNTGQRSLSAGAA